MQSIFEDEFNFLRQKYLDLLTGGTSYNICEEVIAKKIDKIDVITYKNWSSMNLNKTWDDLENSSLTKSSSIVNMINRLNQMALGWVTYGSSYFKNVSLLNDIKRGLDWLYKNRYNESIDAYDNWWGWKIGVPRQLIDTTIILYKQLSSEQIKSYMNAIYHFVPAVTHHAANRADICKVITLRGIIIKDSATIKEGSEGLNEIFPYVKSEDGFYKDGSYIDHTCSGGHPYAGSYGIVLMSKLIELLWLLNDSSWDNVSLKKENMHKWIFDTFEPNLYKGQMLHSVRGRSISRYFNDRILSYGDAFINSLLLKIEMPDNPYIDLEKSIIKYHLLNSDENYYYENCTIISEYQKAKEIMADPEITPRSELIGHYQFYNQDTVVHRRPGWIFSLRMHSGRVANFETNVSGENVHGWYTGDGMTYIYQNPLDYLNNYFFTVDPHRMPGTTVDRDTDRPDATRETSCYRSSKDFVGGVVFEKVYGLSSMDFLQHDYSGMDISARKSWFMFDNEVVALGAGINSTSGRCIETIIENRALNSKGNNVFIVDGFLKPDNNGWSETMLNIKWSYLEGMGGYFFPEGSTIKGLREKRQGKSFDINKIEYYEGSDEFEDGALNWSWKLIREDNTHWKIKGSELIIKTQKGTKGSLSSTKNILLKEAPRGDFLVTTKLSFSPFEVGQEAGLTVYFNDENYLYISRRYTDSGNKIVIEDGEGGVNTTNKYNDFYGSAIYLRIDKRGDEYSFYVSDDGINWNTPLLTYTHQFKVPIEKTLKLGLFAQNGDKEAAETDAVFDNIDIVHTNNFLTLWFDHTKEPVDSTYSYVLLPGCTSSEVSNYANKPDITILKNNSHIQAVKENTLDLIGVTFWEKEGGTVEYISAYNPCSIISKDTGKEVSIAISDPTHKLTKLTTKLNKSGLSIISKDPEIKVVQLTPAIIFEVFPGVTPGKTFNVKFSMV